MGKLVNEGLTFDDVLLIPAKSDVMPNDINISTRLTKEITLNAPIMSACMDTVTESKMAIAVARQGGIGIIHKNMSIENQASEVDKVKRSEHGVITDPFYLSPNHYVFEANELMSKYHISGVPITENDKLVGIITNRDLRFESDHNKKIYEIMTRENLITAPEGTTLEKAKQILTLHKVEKLPIVDSEGNLTGLITTKDIEKAIKYPNSAKDIHGRLVVGASIDITQEDFMKRAEKLINAKADVLLLDCLHGHSNLVVEAIKQLKDRFENIQLIAGNVATAEGTVELIKAGADAIKVGIGSGSICTTSVITGVGVPQFSAICECAEAAKPFDVPIIADGGIKFSGDITKALVAGANVCIIGRIFAGCEESPAATELYQGRKYKVYRGMESLASMEQNANLNIPQGVEGRISYKGIVADTIYQLMGGLRLGMGYCGCETISELQENVNFSRITYAGLKEIHPHNIQIIKESPNYSIEY